ncbi:hypothetical protein [Opitutus sp. ER46]|uniref:hypothetical protein n=1 Tax=Opitutus sp. ER46 TaxID=2161864 RepID=UPI000D313F60|nr:hypothetical protein [Opitutus sp. ER46]PTX92462.1 hypothetical protein DB354_14095 [Opitutus sp. ER46]
MNLTKKTMLVVGLIAATAGYAQPETSNASVAVPSGLLGQSYTELGYAAADVQDMHKDVHSVGIAANVPVTAYLDLGAGYSYNWVRGLAHANTIGASATAYKTVGTVKPFVGAGVGYRWNHDSDNNEDTIWMTSVGVEIPMGAFTLTPRVVYNDDFNNTKESSQSYTYEVEGNYWVTKTAAVYASAGFENVRNSNQDAIVYSIGARLKF